MHHDHERNDLFYGKELPVVGCRNYVADEEHLKILLTPSAGAA